MPRAVRRALLWIGLVGLWVGALVCEAQVSAMPNLRHPLLRDLVGWWRGSPGFTGANQIYDLVNRNHGTFTAMSYGDGVSGWSASTRTTGLMQVNCDGTDDQVTIPPHATLTDLQTLTVVLWVNLVSYGESALGRLVDKRDLGGWNFLVNNNDASNALAFNQTFSTADGQWSVDNVLSLTTWLRVGVTYDSSSTATVPTFYVNGVAYAPTITHSSPSGTRGSDVNSTLRLCGNAASTRWFQGALGDVRLWRRVLSDTEMAEDYRLALLGDPGLFEERSVVTVLPGSGRRGSFFPFFQ